MSIRLKISAFILFFVMALTVMDHHNMVEAKENKQYDADQLKEMAAEFFSVKCGIPKKVLRKSKYEVIKEDDDWIVRITEFAEPYYHHIFDTGTHLMRVSITTGELLSWDAHGADYNEPNPDVWAMGEDTLPLERFAQKDDVITQLKSDFLKQYGEPLPDECNCQVRFMYHEKFGRMPAAITDEQTKLNHHIPVWLIHIYHGDQLCWKAAYSYRGKLMSLVKAEQDFTKYSDREEDFLCEVYEGDILNVQLKMLHAVRDSEQKYSYSVSNEQIYEWLQEWAPKYKSWLQEHPYSHYGLMDYLLDRFPKFK